jgi:hypothetical protein
MSMLFPESAQARPEGASRGFHQGEYWVNAAGEWVRIDSMAIGYIENVMAMLKRTAVQRATVEAWRMEGYRAFAPDGAYEACAYEMERMLADPESLIKNTTLYRALRKRRKSLRKQLKKAGLA